MKAMELKRKLQEIGRENEKAKRQEKLLLEEIYIKGELR
jgi:hypothetical protein